MPRNQASSESPMLANVDSNAWVVVRRCDAVLSRQVVEGQQGVAVPDRALHGLEVRAW